MGLLCLACLEAIENAEINLQFLQKLGCPARLSSLVNKQAGKGPVSNKTKELSKCPLSWIDILDT